VNPDEGNVLGDDDGEIVLGEGEVKAEVTAVKTQFNVKVRGIVGMNINTSFTLQNFTGKSAGCGSDLHRPRTAMHCLPRWKTTSCSIRLPQVALSSARQRTIASNGVSLFIPNTAFRNVTESRIQFFIAIYDVTSEDDAPLLGTSEPVTLRLRR
jgi:hypothetical protein